MIDSLLPVRFRINGQNCQAEVRAHHRGTRCRGAVRSAAGSLHSASRVSVRLLHPRTNYGGKGSTSTKPIEPRAFR